MATTFKTEKTCREIAEAAGFELTHVSESADSRWIEKIFEPCAKATSYLALCHFLLSHAEEIADAHARSFYRVAPEYAAEFKRLYAEYLKAHFRGVDPENLHSLIPENQPDGSLRLTGDDGSIGGNPITAPIDDAILWRIGFIDDLDAFDIRREVAHLSLDGDFIDGVMTEGADHFERLYFTDNSQGFIACIKDSESVFYDFFDLVR